MDKMVEQVTVAGEVIQLRHDSIPIEKLVLDNDNPRIRYRLKLEQNGKSLDDVINAMPEVAALRKDIETNGGLRERIIVQPITAGSFKGSFKVVEGNVRVTCISGLHHGNLNDERWKTVPARVLPENVSEKTIAILLSDLHVAGKIEWAAHEKAGQIYHMQKLGITIEEIAIYLRMNRKTVSRLLHAYSLMTDIFLKMEENKDKERKFSYFFQVYGNKRLRNRITDSPGFKKDFCRWVGEGKIPETADLNRLADILDKPSTRKQFEDTHKKKDEADHRKWFDEIYKVVELDEPEKGIGPHADLLRAWSKVREQNTGITLEQIGVLKTDETSRKRLLETYDSIMEVMAACDLTIPKKRAA